jgi:signal transduction histidine kinase
MAETAHRAVQSAATKPGDQAAEPSPVPFRHRLGTKLTLTLIGVGLIPIILFAGYTILVLHRTVTETSRQVLYATTRDYVDRAETWIRRGLDQVRMAARLPAFAAVLDDTAASVDPKGIRGDLTSLRHHSPVFIRSVALLDMEGQVVLNSPANGPAIRGIGRRWFEVPLLTGEPTFQLSPQERAAGQLVFSAPLMRGSEPVGVLRIGYHMAALEQLLAQVTDISGVTSFVALLMEDGTLLASDLPSGMAGTALWNVGEPVPIPGLLDWLGQPTREQLVEVEFDHLGVKSWTASLQALDNAPWRIAFFLPSEQFLAPTRRRITVALLIAGGLMFLLAALGYASVQAVSRELHSLAAATRSLAAGDLDIRVPEKSRDECGLLARAFNHMAGQLARRTAALIQARHEAEAASRAKSEFLGMMSHEVRTPLNAVIGYSDLLLNDSSLSGEHRDGIGVIRRSGKQLLGMLNNILDFTKLEAGKVETDPAPFPVLELFSDAVEQTAAEAARKGLEVILEPLGTVPERVIADGPKLRQILLNLLFNALKFTERGGVQVFFQTDFAEDGDSGNLRIMVQDTGIGIRPEVREKLFQPFTQGDSSTTRRYGGTGLGLVISRQIARVCGGDLIECSGAAGGACFSLSVPVRRPDCESLPGPVLDHAHQGKPVCLLSQNPLSHGYLKCQLEKAGLACHAPPCGEARLLLVDQPANAPGEFIQRARKECARLDHTPVLILHPHLQQPLEAPSSPLKTTLSKPVLPHELLSRINALLNGGKPV